MRVFLSSTESIDLSDSILDSSADPLTQKAITFCILDPRPYAPPLESPQYRLIYLRLSSELKLGIQPGLVESLIKHGFKSLTLLSLMSEKHLRILGRLLRLDSGTIHALRESLQTLNRAPLEPLYSHKKYLIMRRNNKIFFREDKRLMDLLHIDEPPRDRLPKMSRPYFPPIAAKSVCSSSSDEDSIISSLSSCSHFSGMSSHLQTGVFGYCPLIFCPRHATPMEFPKLFRHLILVHNPYRARMKEVSMSRNFGSVELEFSFGDAMRVKPESVLWFGPTEFLFDGVPFYEIVYRISSPSKNLKKDVAGGNNYFMFWLFVGSDARTAQSYSYVISLYKDKENRNTQRRSVTSFEENPLNLYGRNAAAAAAAGGCNNNNRRTNTSAYFTFEESKLKNIAFENGTLKYYVKVFKNRMNNNNNVGGSGGFNHHHHSNESNNHNNYQTKRRHNKY